jgi:hypothetical protein
MQTAETRDGGGKRLKVQDGKMVKLYQVNGLNPIPTMPLITDTPGCRAKAKQKTGMYAGLRKHRKMNRTNKRNKQEAKRISSEIAII